MKYIILIAAVSLATGCTSLMKASDTVGEQIGKGVIKWCDNTSQTTRDQVRADANKYAAPHSIAVTCVE